MVVYVGGEKKCQKEKGRTNVPSQAHNHPTGGVRADRWGPADQPGGLAHHHGGGGAAVGLPARVGISSLTLQNVQRDIFEFGTGYPLWPPLCLMKGNEGELQGVGTDHCDLIRVFLPDEIMELVLGFGREMLALRLH